MGKDYPDIRIKVPRFKEEAGYFTTEKRSKMMGKIRGKNTRPELLFRKALSKPIKLMCINIFRTNQTALE